MSARRQIEIPSGSWPIRMPETLAAGYVGERTVEGFLKRVGSEYPRPVVDEGSGKGRRRLWLRADLERAVLMRGGEEEDEVA
ncbi:hypothetical protein [Mangrovibrevibacter kandeliae]|uniref:hypothetical protein n=1 Tax=Mangrovibrevibacter kandeliae TaxID=2968473 RepID=UPI00211872DD|nr:hypothetical protein [Aurantimonas sp. CSK15Z-1]MCQ8781661.1 hypothetical protein [Aurantimonas sp. CSK15Z-1]